MPQDKCNGCPYRGYQREETATSFYCLHPLTKGQKKRRRFIGLSENFKAIVPKPEWCAKLCGVADEVV